MRILICDDDIFISDQLRQYLKKYFERNQLKTPEIVSYATGEELLSDSKNKDIVFLDVELPGLSGIIVGNQLKNKNDNVIIFILTSYTEYLDDAMRFHVFRYLSKPLDKHRLYKNLKDALQLYNSSVTKILIETKNNNYTILASDIIFVETHGRRVIIHTAKQDYESIYPMQYWQDKLNMPCFFSSHRSFIVNLKYVCNFDHATIHLCDNKYEAYLTRRKYTQFKEAYLLYLESMR